MANLINRITQQIVEGVDAEHFLSNVEDAAHWVEHAFGEAVDSVESLFTPSLASDMPTDAPEAAEVPVLTDAVEVPAIEVPAEAAAIAANPEQA